MADTTISERAVSAAVTVFDNGGQTFDRYTVGFDLPYMDDGALLVGDTGNVPNGVCMWAPEPASGDYDGEPIAWADVPEPVRRAIMGAVGFSAHLLELHGDPGMAATFRAAVSDA